MIHWVGCPASEEQQHHLYERACGVRTIGQVYYVHTESGNISWVRPSRAVVSVEVSDTMPAANNGDGALYIGSAVAPTPDYDGAPSISPDNFSVGAVEEENSSDDLDSLTTATLAGKPCPSRNSTVCAGLGQQRSAVLPALCTIGAWSEYHEPGVGVSGRLTPYCKHRCLGAAPVPAPRHAQGIH